MTSHGATVEPVRPGTGTCATTIEEKLDRRWKNSPAPTSPPLGDNCPYS